MDTAVVLQTLQCWQKTYHYFLLIGGAVSQAFVKQGQPATNE
jgi:hypothetical protein